MPIMVQESLILDAPLAGAWIEITYKQPMTYEDYLTLPSRERGLKSHWVKFFKSFDPRRSPRGSVD